MIEGNGAKIIDINMGCPAKKVTSGQSGSALMRTPDFALQLVEGGRAGHIAGCHFEDAPGLG